MFASMSVPGRLVATAALVCATIALPASAQPYPNRPIRLILPFPPGGPVDGFARQMGPRLSASLKQSIVLDNRPGAAGMIAIEAGARAAPDGYTMLMVSSSYGASAATLKLPYDPVNDITPVILLGRAPQLMAAHPSAGIASPQELIAHAKAHPGKLNYGSSGTGGSVHLATEFLAMTAGIKLTHVPYKGQGPALNDVLGGQIQLFGGSPMIVYPHVKGGRLRGIGVTSLKRTGAMPEIPAFAEVLSGYETYSWQAILGPKGLPRDIVMRWNQEVNRLLELSEFRERLAGDSMEPVGGPPERFLEILRSDVAKWKKVVQVSAIKVGQ
jgi:tripartite-type tricarboxylate transporter receptor subunit TctC